MRTVKRWLKLNLDYRHIGGMHYVWVGKFGASFWVQRKPHILLLHSVEIKSPRAKEG